MTSSVSIRLLILNDHRLFRDCLASFLSLQTDIEVEATAELKDGLSKVLDIRPDVVLLDVVSSAQKARENMIRIRDQAPRVRIVALGTCEAEEAFVEWVQLGARAYTVEETSADKLCEIIRWVSRGEAHFSPRMAYILCAHLSTMSRRNHQGALLDTSRLTPREIEILRMIARGLGNQEIADSLHLSLYTVKNHVHNILDKLKVDRRARAAQLAYEHGLVV